MRGRTEAKIVAKPRKKQRAAAWPYLRRFYPAFRMGRGTIDRRLAVTGQGTISCIAGCFLLAIHGGRLRLCAVARMGAQIRRRRLSPPISSRASTSSTIKAPALRQRRERFAAFVIGLTDVRRVALFLLGRYAATAAPADIEAYVAAYQDYVLAVYQSYFAQYAGQSLHVIESRERAANDYVVRTMITGNNADADGNRFPRAHRWRQARAGGYGCCRNMAGAGAARSIHRGAGPEQRRYQALTAHLSQAKSLYR